MRRRRPAEVAAAIRAFAPGDGRDPATAGGQAKTCDSPGDTCRSVAVAASTETTLSVNRALVVDDHPIVLQAVGDMLLSSGVGCVFTAHSASSACRLHRRHRPDLIIADVNLGDGHMGGISLVRKIRETDPATPILALSMYSEPAIASQVVRAGASGYVVKDRSPREILAAIAMVSKGTGVFDGRVCGRECDPLRAPSRLEDMNSRELTILSLLGRGFTYKQIAGALGIGYSTVADSCSLIKFKLNVGTLQELIRVAIMALFIG